MKRTKEIYGLLPLPLSKLVEQYGNTPVRFSVKNGEVFVYIDEE